MQMMKAVLAAVALAVTGAQAQGAILTYEYIGAEIESWDPEYHGISPGDPAPISGSFPAHGYFTVDTDLLPVSLPGATIDIYMIQTDEPPFSYPVQCPSLRLIRRRCLLGTCVGPICSQQNGSLNPADGLPLPRLQAAATGGKSQAVAGHPELRWPFVRHAGYTLGALSP